MDCVAIRCTGGGGGANAIQFRVDPTPSSPNLEPMPISRSLAEIHKIMNTLLDRFCRYVQINTQADENAGTYPSSPGQLELGRLVVQELRAMTAADVEVDGHGIVMATLPATTTRPAPTITWIAHL